MRNLILCLLLLAAAALLVACSDPVRNARKTMSVIEATTSLAATDVAHSARIAVLDLADAEGARRGQELKTAGCGPANATQPASAIALAPCKSVVAASEARLAASVKRVQDAQRRADAAIDGVYAALRTAVKFLRALVGPRPPGWEATLTTVVGAAVKSGADLAEAMRAFKLVLGGVK